MSHIHIPDGVIAPIWLLFGFILTGLIMALAFFQLRRRDIKEMVPKLGVVCAIALLAMSVPLGPLPAHLNLTVLIGIVLGPWLGFVAAFIINLFLALIGHGGISVVGLNTLLIGSEVILGSIMFTLFTKYLSLVKASALTVLVTLLLSNSLLFGVINLAGVNPDILSADEHSQSEKLTDPENVRPAQTKLASPSNEHPGGVSQPPQQSWPQLASILLGIAGLGIILETGAITVIIKFIAKIRPDILPH